MLLGRLWTCVVALLLTIGDVSANEARAVLPRQGSNPSSQLSAFSSSSTSVIITTSSQDGKPTSMPPSTTAASSQPTSFTTSLIPSVTMPPVTNISSILGIGTDTTTLPLPPAITPALSVAGVFLILSGTVYTLIGIKNKWIQIFISAAYLTSLSITVLIIYVINPPISNAVQGAYFVAAFVPALIIGGGALIFKDLTEGIGCVVGGFCFSMWVLVLEPGGTITSTAGKVIFIGLFCVLFYGLSFSHYTRSYALIGSCSLGGATAIVLGIDCFSLAGFKEFWLYIWDLNDNLFPLATATYPITRGIRVETAAVVIFTFIGVLSQLRIWKVIQERRRQQMQEKEAADRERQQAEEEIGRRLVAGNGREQEQWEAAYGDGTRAEQRQTDSGVGTENNSLRKYSMSTAEPRPSGASQSHVIEMSTLDQTSKTEAMSTAKLTGPSKVSVYATTDDKGSQVVNPRGSSMNLIGSAGRNTAPGEAGNRRSTTGSLMLGPLPFEVPDTTPNESDDTSSIATYASSNRRNSRYLSRLSGSSLFMKISKRSQRNSLQRLPSHDNPEITTASNADAARSTDELSHQPEPGASPRSHHIRENSIGLSIEPEHVHIPDSHFDAEAKHTDNTVLRKGNSHDIADSYLVAARGDTFGTADQNDSDVQQKSLLQAPSEINEVAISPPSEPASNQSFAGRLPEAGPKVASVYRTNEWAKHLDKAEKPEVDRLGLLKPSESQESNSSEEAAAPVDLQALQTTALGSPPQAIRSPADIPRNFLSEYMRPENHSPPASHTSTESLRRKSSQQSDLSNANRPTSTTLQPLKTKPLRTSSNPILTSALVESPIEEGIETTTFQPRYVSSPLAPTGNTLLAQRSSILLNKHLSSTPNYSRTSSYSTIGLPADIDENIPLSQRRSLLQMNGSPKPQQQSTYPPPTGARSLSPSARRASMLAAWRSSLQQDVPVQVIAGHEAETRRAEMLAEKQREGLRKQEELLRDRKREENWGQAMRTGGMARAHREVLSRMQSGVNERLRSGDRD